MFQDISESYCCVSSALYQHELLMKRIWFLSPCRKISFCLVFLLKYIQRSCCCDSGLSHCLGTRASSIRVLVWVLATLLLILLPAGMSGKAGGRCHSLLEMRMELLAEALAWSRSGWCSHLEKGLHLSPFLLPFPTPLYYSAFQKTGWMNKYYTHTHIYL